MSEPRLFDDTMTVDDLWDRLAEIGEWVDCLSAETVDNTNMCPISQRKIREACEDLTVAFQRIDNAIELLKEAEEWGA